MWMFYENENTVGKSLLPFRQVVRYTFYMKKNSDVINVYWAIPNQENNDQDWSFLYPKPKTLFSELIKERKDPKNLDSFLVCPAVGHKFKKTLVFNNAINSSYEFGRYDNGFYINPTSDQYINAVNARKEILFNKPTFEFSLSYLFFADSPMDVSFTSPYFHKPQYMQSGASIPGEFNIGQWFRPYNFEVQTWLDSGEFHIKENEPLFYAEFKTDRPIALHRFNITKQLNQYKNSNTLSINLFGPFQSLSEKYEKFKQVGYREKILTEIKKNFIDEEPYIF
jgi:hypothetical protein